MEEESGVKAAPVTRLRRRLSVESSEDTKSPGPSTPTKKRGGRLAAKPQLELIDEHAIQNSPKKSTRKSLARGVSESDEKPVTPARRSARVKSNTSLVLEPEEKIQTPSRRTTRISSNTSIISETPSVVESPRAKRATARRNSKAETSNVTAVTPGRTTRTRKGSTSSIDSMVQSYQPEILTVIEIIPDDPENQLRQSITTDESLNNKIIPQESENQLCQSSTNDETINNKTDTQSDSPTVRKSPRLMAKKSNKDSNGKDSDDTAMCHLSECHHEELTAINTDDKQFVQKSDAVMNELVLESSKLTKKLVKKKETQKNKSLSDIEMSDIKSKRHRTQSWTKVCTVTPDEGKFYSDNESTRRKFKDSVKIFKDKRQSGDASNDALNEKSTEQSEVDLFLNTSKKIKKNRSFVVDNNLETKNTNHTVKETSKDLNKSDDSNKENVLGVAPVHKDSSALDVMSQDTPVGEIKSMVFLEDSDSNAGSLGKQEKEQIDSGDQCVPIVLHSNAVKTSKPEESIIYTVNSLTEPTCANTSCEPMDIDETMPESISLTDFKEDINSTKSAHSRKSSLTQKEKSFKSRRKSSMSSLEIHETGEKSNFDQSFPSSNSQTSKLRNSSLCMPQEENFAKNKKQTLHSLSEPVNVRTKNTVQDLLLLELQGTQPQKPSLSMQESDGSPNTSKRKSSITLDLEKSQYENKSTLVLSQIKDMSVSAENSVSKSPQNSNDHSKSNVQDSMKETPVNKNLTLNYLTSTPVQQKNAEKLNIQMNTSIIVTPNNESKKKISKDVSQENVFVASNSEKHKSDDDRSESEDSENESSTENSKLFTTEAEDAGDDYESGDSQDSDEIQYELDNEIVDKGETLTSEDEMSDDSDYEKDSFVVSSVEEDDDLLSGSGDNLNMSDNELTMNPKSKNKFNERKQKERKKASREIYEARHEIKQTGKTTNDEAKIKNRRRLDSTLLKSDDDNNLVPPKKNKRMRLESTLDSSQDEQRMKNRDETNISEEIFIHKKKKTKRFSESVSKDTTINEKEISINAPIIAGEDPLIVKVKPEPKTPQKEFDLSTIHFTDREEVVQVAVNENVSIIKPNETLDPLQTSLKENDKVTDEDFDSISENEEIAKNYESMLEELNNGNKQNLKTLDLSLNLNKKSKKTKHSIVEKLNLTENEIAKKDHSSSQFNEKAVKRVFKKLANTDEESSDSIDLKLIFPDSSNDSLETKDNVSKPENSGMPLKTTEGKTNIFDNKAVADGADYVDGLIKNSNAKKNKKLKSNINIAVNNMAQGDEDNETLPFFIDTKGDMSDTAECDPGMISLEGNTEKNNNSVINFDLNEFAAANENDNTQLKVLFVSDKKIKRNKKVSENENSHVLDIYNDSTKTPSSDKKKKKKRDRSQNISLTVKAAADESNDAPLEVSFVSDKIKQNNKVSENESSPVCNTDNDPAKISSNKKKKKKLDQLQNITLTADENYGTLEVSFVSDKKIKRIKKDSENERSNVYDAKNDPAKTSKSGKKETKKSDQSQNISLAVENDNNGAPLEGSFVTDKKKKRNKKEYENKSGNVYDTNNDLVKTPSERDPALKNGENMKTPHPEATSNVATENIAPENERGTNEHNISISKKKQKDFEIYNTNMPANELVNSLIKEQNTKKKSEKRKTVKDAPYSIDNKVNENAEVITTDNAVIEESINKKRKRNSSASKSTEEVVLEGINNSQENNQLFKGNKKKKLKTSSNVDDMHQFQIQSVDSNGNRPKKLKQNTETVNSAEAHIKTSNKRKKRDDDESYNSSKKFKDNLLEKIHVPRLPAEIIQQLDEKPKKEAIVIKKAKVTSTTDFSVEETITKRRKPSNFLEETVYLNQDDNTPMEKKKSAMKRPKVLPFLPTVSISDSGFTTKFQVNVISQKVEFSAKHSETTNFKEKYLNTKRFKKLRTYDLYKKQRCMKLSKF